MAKKAQDYREWVDNALQRYQAGCNPVLIELPERAVFPHLISAQPSTARKSRGTGMLLGQPAPLFVRRGRSIRYRLSDVLKWLEDADVVNNTAKASMKNRGNTNPPV